VEQTQTQSPINASLERLAEKLDHIMSGIEHYRQASELAILSDGLTRQERKAIDQERRQAFDHLCAAADIMI
jgi:hypothetical protein